MLSRWSCLLLAFQSSASALVARDHHPVPDISNFALEKEHSVDVQHTLWHNHSASHTLEPAPPQETQTVASTPSVQSSPQATLTPGVTMVKVIDIVATAQAAPVAVTVMQPVRVVQEPALSLDDDMTLPLKPPQQTAAVDSSYSDKHKSHGKNKNHGKNGSRGKHWKHGKNGHHGIDKYGAPDRTTWNEDNIFTDYTQYIPDTGVTRYYDLTVDEANLAPDGVDAPFMQVFNGQFPGPLIEADWGDHIEVRVHNHLRNNGTSIHWHGFIHTNNTQNDGVNGVTQCPIPPLSSLTYRFRAQRYGTSWYHSHTSVQYGNGLYGPILIRGPSSANWDVDLGTVNIGDWYHKSQFELVQDFFVSGPPTASATVFNGQGVFNDNGTLRGSYYDITKELKFRPGRKHLLRLINSASDAKYEISLDEHTMTVVSLDWIPVRPFKTKTLFLSIGQRAEVIIKATEDPRKSYWFRADTTALGMNRGTTCGDKNLSANQSKAIISYVGADGSDPDSTPWTYTPHCSDVAMNNAKPVVALTLPPPIFRQNHSLDPIKPNATGDIVFNVDNSSLYLNWNKPTLNLINDGFTQFPRQYNVYQLNGTDRDSVIVVLQDNTGIPHPIHLHGHDMSIAALGNGTWNGTINFDNPPRRDTVQVEGGGHLVMHFALDNPGTWLWHCHIAFHVSAGLGAQFVERIQDINTVENVTQTYQTCSQWQAWTDFNLVLQTDSGV